METANNIILHRETTACFTGHRPEKLPDGGDRYSLKTRVIKSMLYSHVTDAVNDGYDTFITGMQRGIDLWAGEIVLSLMAKSSLRLICAIPYEGFGKEFTGVDRWTFERILEAASAKITICPHYSRDCMTLRNKFMVENSSRLIAAVDDPKSGTGQTLRHARSAKLDIRMIDLGKLFPQNIGTRDFEANTHSYEVITFDIIENDIFADKIDKAAAEPFQKTPDKPFDNSDSGIFPKKINETPSRRQEVPSADPEIDERYSAANDETLTLL